MYRLSFVLVCSLSESSDENMMDAHNLSVCFGPTLMPMPPDHDQVRNQNYVNDLIRILIVYHEKIFPADTGIVYEKCMVEEEGQVLEIFSIFFSVSPYFVVDEEFVAMIYFKSFSCHLSVRSCTYAYFLL